jgi:predicted methyltransferase
VKFLPNIRNALKKETGRFLIMDQHRAATRRGTLVATSGGRCRIDEAVVRKYAEEAGFTLDRESDLLGDYSTDDKSSHAYSNPM